MAATEHDHDHDVDPTIPTTRWTREAWLEEAVNALRPRFTEVGMPLPERVHVSVGFGLGARRESSTILGQCWATWKSADSVNHVFISPELGDTARVLDVLVHELIHVADDCEHGHKGPFADAATRLGLTGKMTATTAGPELADAMFLLATELGSYPHGQLNPAAVPAVKVGPDGEPVPAPTGTSGPPKQTTRQHKIQCPDCGYTVRVTAKWIAVGLPTCVCGGAFQLA